MSVFRVNKTKNYTVMSNQHLQDKELSLKAKGLLSVMLSLPDEWDYSINGLASISLDGVSAIKNIIKELQVKGYLVINKKMPNETKTGRIEYIYDVYEQKQEGKKQEVENQPLEFLGVEKQEVENRIQLNTNKQNTNKQNTKELNTKHISSDADASRESDKLSKEDKIVKEVIEYFNVKAGKKYQWNTKASSSHLRARIKEGFTIDDFKYVIDNQVELWKYDVRMAKFLRPMTLFNPEKFESYLNAPKAKADEWDLIINDETKQKDDYFYNFLE